VRVERLRRVAAQPATGALVVLVVACAWLRLVSPWLGLYQISPDEGLNLAKAALVSAGYGPYGKMWNDQGPVLTYILAALQHPLPFDVDAARVVVIAFASLLLAGLHLAVARRNGFLAASVTVVLLATAPAFIALSSSVLIGLPAVSLAVAALATVDPASRHRATRAAVAGLLFGLSLQTKLFTLAIAPALLVAVLGVGLASGRSGRLRDGLAWAGATVLTFALIAIVSGQATLTDLVATHVADELRDRYSLWGSLSSILATLRQSPTILLPGLMALLTLPFLDRAHRGALLVPGVWLATAFAALALHHPVQSHQVLLLIVPLSWMGGTFIAALRLPDAWPPSVRPASAVGPSLVIAGVAAAVAVGALPRHGTLAAPTPAELSAHALRPYGALGGWVVADLPIAAFRNRQLVPPELAVFSQKRLNTGNLTPKNLWSSIARRRPTQIVFQRFPQPDILLDRLTADYVVAARGVSDSNFIHYVARYPDLGLDGAGLRGQLADLVDAMAATAGSGGGYATAFDPATGARYGEQDEPISATATWMRPRGATYEIGQRLLRAYSATGEVRYRDLALRAALAMARSQSCDGGWAPAAEPRGACPTETTAIVKESFDEGLQAGAIAFLLDAAEALPEGPDRTRLIAAARNGLAYLVTTQNEDGAWPQEPSATSGYHALSTLNDDVTPSHIRILLRGYETFGEEAYAEAARRGLAFLLAAQLESGGWAQQYDADLKPAPARSFEPAAAASIESAHAMVALIEGHEVLDDRAWLAAASRAERWLNTAEIAPENWARFYDVGTNKPVYGDRDGSIHFALSEISRERRKNYDWRGRFPDVLGAIRLTRAAAEGPAAYRAEREAIAAATELADLARGIDKKRKGARAATDKAGLVQAERWLIAMDSTLAAVEHAGRGTAGD
jgi:hypothetical protein